MKLVELAHARSGDKGNHANIGVIARNRKAFELIEKLLTPEKVANYFSGLKPTQVERFRMPGILAFNFLLHNALGGGGSRSLRIDSQGKTLATVILEMDLETE
ncbi:MAG: hypothetical protein VX438_06935 [Planctomycetota bacterium]|jgi:hypothetical protein|nr:hypothetical protein [Planctomycetota bacterium]